MEKVKHKFSRRELHTMLVILSSYYEWKPDKDLMYHLLFKEIFRKLAFKLIRRYNLIKPNYLITFTHEEALSLYLAFEIGNEEQEWESVIFSVNRKIHQHYA